MNLVENTSHDKKVSFYFLFEYKGKSTYQTHWLECCAIARKLFWGCSFSKQCLTSPECRMASKMDNQISTGPIYLRNMLVLTWEKWKKPQVWYFEQEAPKKSNVSSQVKQKKFIKPSSIYICSAHSLVIL